MAENQKIIAIAVDKSDQASNAFDWYFENIHQKGNLVVLLYSPELNQMAKSGSSSFSPGVWHQLWEKEQEATAALQAKYDQKLKSQNASGKFVILRKMASPGEAVVDGAKEQKAEMIVMGTRGMGTVRRTILGSVSDYVIHHAHVPVVIYRQ